MKKIILLGTLVAFLGLTYFIMSCTKKSESCKTCTVNTDFQLTNTILDGNTYELKLYTDKDQDFHFQYKKEVNLSHFENLFSDLKIRDLIAQDLKSSKIVSF